jgi:hypothetical protein
MVTGRLGYSPFVSPGTPDATDITIELHPQSASLALTAPGSSPRRRTFSSASTDCREISEALALALALALDPQLNGPAPAPAPPAPPPPAPAPPPKPPPPSPRPKVLLSAGADVTAGISPYPTAGTSLGVGLRGELFSLLLEGRLVWSRSVPLDNGVLSSSVLLASLLPCVHFKFASACAQLSAGALQIDGAVPDGQRESSFLALAGGRLQAEWLFLDWLGVRGHLGVAAVLTRTTVRADDMPIWVTAPATFDLGLAVFTVL